MRVVFDTNIYTAAAVRGGFAEDIIELANQDIITLLTSQEILQELQDKLLAKFDKSEDDIEFFISKIKHVVKTKEKNYYYCLRSRRQ